MKNYLKILRRKTLDFKNSLDLYPNNIKCLQKELLKLGIN